MAARVGHRQQSGSVADADHAAAGGERQVVDRVDRALGHRGPEGARFDVAITDRVHGTERSITGLTLPMFGAHNVQNSLVPVAIASEMGIAEDALRKALATFSGVKRRFTRTGVVGGITVIDDYGHHPVEMAATLAAARGAFPGRRLVLAFQKLLCPGFQRLYQRVARRCVASFSETSRIASLQSSSACCCPPPRGRRPR